jgi:hypothetical protein
MVRLSGRRSLGSSRFWCRRDNSGAVGDKTPELCAYSLVISCGQRIASEWKFETL